MDDFDVHTISTSIAFYIVVKLQGWLKTNPALHFFRINSKNNPVSVQFVKDRDIQFVNTVC